MILIAAGSNVPFCKNDSQEIVLNAFFALERLVDTCLVSSLYETPAWPDPRDPPFINAVAKVATKIAPSTLLQALHAIEAGFGRQREERNSPRTLDLDLLAYDDLRQSEPGGLILPHPRLHEREFVLAPLCEIAPDWSHPVTGRKATQMLQAQQCLQARKIPK